MRRCSICWFRQEAYMVDGAQVSFDNTVSGMAGVMGASALMPEALIASTALVLLLGGAFAANKGTDRLIGGLGLLVLVCLLVFMSLPAMPPGRHEFFSHMFVADGFSHFVKTL